MLDTMVERAANRLIEITYDEAIRELKAGRDWMGFLDFLKDLFEMLGPLFDKCFVTSRGRAEPTAADMIARAAKWEPVMDKSRRARRREVGVFENFLLSRWLRQMDHRIDEEVGDEFDNTEICEVVLNTIATATQEEVTELRSDFARLREEAA